MRRISLLIIVLLLPASVGSAQEIKLPVFFLRYDGGAQIEELEDEEEPVLDYRRDKITFRIKEQWSDEFTTNLYTAVFSKRCDNPSEDYRYFYLNPNCVWDITDRLRWTSDFRSKWIWEFDPSGEDYDLDLTSLRVKTELTYKLLEQLKIIPSFQSVFDLFATPEDNRQIYTAGVRFESRINPQVHLNGRYRIVLPAPLGAQSAFADDDVEHEFGINLSWDPNK
jgi:hypothetical protein